MPGTAIVLSSRETVSCSIESLSASGVLLAGDNAFARGELLRVLLHVEGARSLGVAIEVTGAELLADGRCRFAARFHDLEPGTAERIHAIVRSALEPQGIDAARAVLVVDDEPDVYAAAERDLSDAGYAVFHAATSLAVVGRLQDFSGTVVAALVDVRLHHINTAALLAQIADEHPRVMRVLTSSPESIQDCDALLSSGRAQAILHKPWTRAALFEALGILDDTDRIVLEPTC
jgi:CheY-like chemotaxis protein